MCDINTSVGGWQFILGLRQFYMHRIQITTVVPCYLASAVIVLNAHPFDGDNTELRHANSGNHFISFDYQP